MPLAPDPHEDDVAGAPPASSAAAADGDDTAALTPTGTAGASEGSTSDDDAGGTAPAEAGGIGSASRPGRAVEENRPRSPRSPAYNRPTSAAYASRGFRSGMVTGLGTRDTAGTPTAGTPTAGTPTAGTAASASGTPTAGTPTAGTSASSTRIAVGGTATATARPLGATGAAAGRAARAGDAGVADAGDGAQPERRRLHWTMATVVGLVAVAGVAVMLSRGGPDDTQATSSPTTAVAPGSADAGGGTAPVTTAPGSASGRASRATAGPRAGAGGAITVGPSPIATVQTYLKAIKAQDCPTMVDMLSPDSWSVPGGARVTRAQAINSCRHGFTTGATDIDQYEFGAVTLVSQTDDNAVVTVAITRAGRPSRENVRLDRVGGEWKITLAQ